MNSLKPTKELLNTIDRLSDYYDIDEETKNKLVTDKSVKIDINTFVDKDNLFEWPNLNNKIDTDGYCYGLNTHIGILSDGTVVPCCLDANGVIELGNIFDETLDNILNKKISTDIVEGFKNNKAVHPLCKKCNFRERFIK
jgi:radical SAM protein with 4Fe4S-binding SPASM domain